MPTRELRPTGTSGWCASAAWPLREHVVSDAEVVVEEHDRFVVVAKREGAPAEIAEQRDPRS